MTTIIEHNVETGEIVERPMTNLELKEYKIGEKQLLINQEQKQNRLLARDALLKKLGITEDEAKLLLS